ncbi:MAG: hypothetical protein Q3993_04545 [Filifactor alocis]|nr:hypothetical protein [Filifactor alocis]
MDLRVEQLLDTELSCRSNEKENGDIDVFVDLEGRTVDLGCKDPRLSRIQFPKVRFLLFRISRGDRRLTLHMMRDIDLFSAFANVELSLEEGEKVRLRMKETSVELSIGRTLPEEG